jgi:hypothetical protein
MAEKWLPVNDPFFENYYEVSNLGRIKSSSRIVERGGPNNRYKYTKPARIIKPRTNGIHPHLFVDMQVRIDGVVHQKTLYVHKAVAEAFLLRPSKKHIYVAHKNGNYNDNRVSNLEWITASMNSIRSMRKYPENRNKLRDYNYKSGYYQKLSSKARLYKDEIIKRYLKGEKMYTLAEDYGCSIATISNIINGK